MCATARHRPGLRVLCVPIHLLPGELVPIGNLSWASEAHTVIKCDHTGAFAVTASEQAIRVLLWAARRRSQSAPRAGRRSRRPRRAASARRVQARRAESAGASTRKYPQAAQALQAESSEPFVCVLRVHRLVHARGVYDLAVFWLLLQIWKCTSMYAGFASVQTMFYVSSKWS